MTQFIYVSEKVTQCRPNQQSGFVEVELTGESPDPNVTNLLLTPECAKELLEKLDRILRPRHTYFTQPPENRVEYNPGDHEL